FRARQSPFRRCARRAACAISPRARTPSAPSRSSRRRTGQPRVWPATGRVIPRRTGGRARTAAGCCTGAPTATVTPRGSGSTAAELARFRRAQLAARAAELVALWDDRLEPRDDEATARRAGRASERQAMWRDLLLFGEHTWGADVSVSAPDSRQTVAQWLYK